MSDKKNMYFAAKEPNDAAEIILSKTQDWFNSLDTNGYLDKLRRVWAAYHGAYYDSASESHQISFGGEQGELAQMGVNHIRNLAQHMHNMITSTRPAMQARSINTDYKSLTQTKLANGLLDYYMRDHRLEKFLKQAVEYSIVFGTGYIKLEWNATIGDVYDILEDGSEMREGDIQFSNLSPFDVMFDTNREDHEHDWVICRSFKNRFDLIAKYPEYEERILSLPTKSDKMSYSAFNFSYDETDMVSVFEFYHKKTEALPEGRYMLFLDKEIVLLDSPMPYKALPIYAIHAGNYLGTPYGYTPLFDLMPIQDAINSLYSTILTNQTAFGVQNILVPRGADVAISELSGGLNVIEANMQAGPIQALNLTATPKEVFDFVMMLEKVMETISGVNAVSRGNPSDNLRSGNALALVQSMTLQFMSGLQASYVAVIEDVGTGIINILKDHAQIPRLATIVGKSNRTYLKEFTGDDLSSVSRVIVDVGNPLAKSTAGRVEMAEQLLQMQAIKTPEQYFSVINTGQLDVMTEDTQSQLFLIKAENERFINGEPVVAVFTDEHALHIKEHASVLSDPDLRLQPELLQAVSAHIQEHIELLRTTDPNTLMILGQQPLQQSTPPQQQQMSQNSGGQVQEMMGGAPVATQLDQMGSVPTNIPSIPTVPAEALPNPDIQAQMMNNVKQ